MKFSVEGKVYHESNYHYTRFYRMRRCDGKISNHLQIKVSYKNIKIGENRQTFYSMLKVTLDKDDITNFSGVCQIAVVVKIVHIHQKTL